MLEGTDGEIVLLVAQLLACLHDTDADDGLAIAQTFVGFDLSGIAERLSGLDALHQDILGDMNVAVLRHFADEGLYLEDGFVGDITNLEDNASALTASQHPVAGTVYQTGMKNLDRIRNKTGRATQPLEIDNIVSGAVILAMLRVSTVALAVT